MEDKIIIYVAGNPDAYPLEYYDSQSETYKGVIPQIFKEFSNQSRFEVLYYQGGTSDNRKHLAENKQVDIVSGCIKGDEFVENTQKEEIFNAVINNNTVSYYICYTDTAPDDFKSELNKFLSYLSQEEVSGLLISSTENIQYRTSNNLTVYTLSFIIIILVCTIICVVRKYKNRLKIVRKYIETDELTGLGNTEYLTRKFQQLISNKEKVFYQNVFLYIDTDRLHRIGNSQEVDDFFKFCAQILQKHVTGHDILAKVSYSGFVILKYMKNTENLDSWVCSVFKDINAYAKINSKPFALSVSAGIYPIKSGDRNIKEIVFNSMQCARIAQKEEKMYLICSEETLRSFAEKRLLQSNIEQAFVRHEFQLYIQFYIEPDTYKIVGGEALSRWNHPQKGIIMPDVFVPLMEKEKSISKLDYYSLEEACKFLQSLLENKVESFFVSCNFSRETFSADNFVEECKNIINKYSFPKELLIFEITESAYVKNIPQIQNNIMELKKYGVSIALDDFGEGFTSFYDLQKYQIDGIKLDKGLIDNMFSKSGNAILRAMVQVSHSLNMTILAEGVETDEQAEELKAIGCDVIQGFCFFVPMPDWEAKDRILKEFFG